MSMIFAKNKIKKILSLVLVSITSYYNSSLIMERR